MSGIQYETAIDIKVTDNAERMLNRIATGLEKLDQLTREASHFMSRLTVGAPALRSVETLEKRMSALSEASVRVGSEIKSNLSGSFNTAKEEAAQVRSEIAGWGKEAKVAAERISAVFGKGGLAGGAGGHAPSIRHGGGSLFGRVTDSVAMGPTESGFLAGMGVGKLPLSMLHANADLQSQVNQYRLAGNSDLDANEGINAAYRSARQVPDVGVSEQFKIFRELASATGDDAGARSMLPQAARALSIMSTVTGKHGDEDMKKLFKFIELRGVAIDEHSHKIDTNKFGAELDYATKAMIAAQGLITPNDMLQFAKQAGSMAKGMTGDQLFSTMLASMEDMGGGRTGTSLTAIGRQFLGGVMTGPKADRLDELGLLNKEGVDRTGKHNVVTDPAKGIVGYDVLFKEGFGAFMDKIIRPHMDAAGIHSRQEQNAELYRSVGTDTARRQIGLFLSGQEQMQMVAERYHKAMSGAEGYDKIYGAGQDYNTSAKAFGESFTTLKAALGDAQGVAPLLMSLAKGVSAIADAVRTVPGLGTGATFGTLAGSAGLMAYGGKQFVTGFGLPAAATQLTVAATELQAAAAKLGGGEVLKDAAKAAGAVGIAGGAGVAAAVAAGLAGGAAAGGMNMPMVDDNGRPIGSWGGNDESNNPAAPGNPIKQWWQSLFGSNDNAAKQGSELGLDSESRRGREMMRSQGADAATIKEEALKRGADAGASTTQGFASADFAGTGSKAGASLLSALSGAMAGLASKIHYEGPAPTSSRAVTVQANLHVDGKRLAQVVTRHQFDDANGPARGSAMVDHSLVYPQVA